MEYLNTHIKNISLTQKHIQEMVPIVEWKTKT